ncbi:MAG: hypothetical protein V1867_04110 [Candidatus Falkowbacteria bacterium]
MKQEIMPTPEEIKKIDEQRKDYDHYANRTARKQNTLIENLTGSNTATTKEDVIRTDADIENNARRLLKIGRMDELQFKKLVDNSLEYSESALNTYHGPRWSKIKGEVNGVNVVLNVKWGDTVNDGRDNSNAPKKYEGKINDKALSDWDARELYYELMKVMNVRQNELDELKGERTHEKFMKKFTKKKEKRLEREQKKNDIQKARKEQTKDDLEKIM